MDQQMQLYWEAFDELITTPEILKDDFNPVYHYDDQLIDGAIVDIGCGQTSPLIKYAILPDRKLIGIDNEEFQLRRLKSRMIEITGAESENWEFLTKDIQHDTLPDGTYSIVILYSILHFFSLQECREIVEKIKTHLVAGSLISICVHSTKFWANDPTWEDNNEYFKHYFTQEDLDELFSATEFDKLYSADIERVYGAKDGEISALWSEKIISKMNIRDPRVKADIRRQAKEETVDAELKCVYRKL